MNRGHVPAEILASYADGSLVDGMCVIVAGHLTFCPRCREHLCRLEALGGALLTEPTPGCCAKPDLAKILRRIDAAEPSRGEGPPPRVRNGPPSLAPACEAIDDLPRCLRARLGEAVVALGWRGIGPGLAAVDVPTCGPGTLRLVRGDAGLVLPEHEHPGASTALILRGRLIEDGEAFDRGDLIFAERGDRHAPKVDASGTCVVLLFDAGDPVELMPRAPSSPA